MSQLESERRGASFPVAALADHLYGGAEARRRVGAMRQRVGADPVFRKSDRPHLNREQLYTRALEKSARFVEVYKEMLAEGVPRGDIIAYRTAIDETLPLDLHFGMFLPTILGQGDDEQKAEWVPKALSLAVVGAYAQTELGHGSNLRALETTATFDSATDEIVIHTPTATAAKFWPGSLGLTATHCIVHARLLVGQAGLADRAPRDHGLHPFIVPLRDDAHQPLPGVTLRDIGPKLGFATTDNGYAAFDHVRIPRRNMLAGHSKLHRDGTYERPKHAKAAYGTMVGVRASIVAGASEALQRATTIAVRFSAVRRQFGSGGPGEPETPVLDYATQQGVLFPLVAAAYAIHFTSEYLSGLHARMAKQVAQAADFTLLPTVHSATAGLKAYTTEVAAAGIEECRRACGGLGYLAASGFPWLYGEQVAAVTYEGENRVLARQAARSLIKAVQSSMYEGANAYLGEDQHGRWAETTGAPADEVLEILLKLHSRRAQAAVRFAARRGASGIDEVRASRAHSQRFILEQFIAAIPDAPDAARPVLRALCELHGLHNMITDLGDFLESQAVAPNEVPALRERFGTALALLRPDAIPLVDAFDLPDFLLDSALGRYDGRVYEAVLEKVDENPLNKTPPAGIQKHLLPMLQRGRASL